MSLFKSLTKLVFPLAGGKKAIIGTIIAVAGFLTGNPYLILVGISMVARNAFGKDHSAQARQASVLSLNLGEGGREAIFGRSATGGTLLDAFNFGGQFGTDWEVLVIKVADHRCDALEGFLINDTYYAYAADGVQAGFNGQLEVYWMDGSAGQAANAYLTTNSASRITGTAWTSDDRCASMAVFIAAYKADKPNADTPVWPQGRPTFKPVVRGKLCYDPRLGPLPVVFLMGAVGADGSTTIPDESPAAHGNGTADGDAQIDTAQSVFGGSSLRVDGAGGDKVLWASSSDWELSSANSDAFTIEGRTRWNTIGTNKVIIAHSAVVGSVGWYVNTAVGSASELQFSFSTDGGGTPNVRVTTTGAGLATGAWFAWCVEKDATGKIRIYINGVMKGSATPANSVFHQPHFTIGLSLGATWTNGGPMDGWIQEVRITKGEALYADDAGYTVSASAFPRVYAGASWDDPSTWEWSENAAVCDYNYDRGIYAEDQVDEPKHLLIGRGLSEVEAPAARVVARADLCDEAVTLLAGGTEPRYRVGGVVFADETFGAVKQKFADAMGGEIVKRAGGVEVLPGQAQTAVRELTDLDFVIGEPVTYEPFLPESERVNTVIPRYVAPDQLWASHAAPVRRSTADILEDGGLKLVDMAMELVTSQTQAQRCAEIRRRLARKEQRAALPLSPKHADLEDGDWIGWTSDRFFAGGRVEFRIEAYGVQSSWRTSVVLREIADTCYDWVAATDEGVPGQAPVDEFGDLPAVELTGVDAFGISKEGPSGNRIPAVRFVWDAPVDPAILKIRAEIRETGQLEVAPTLIDDVDAGTADTQNGVGPGSSLQARLVPLGVPGRRFTASAWIDITALDFSEAGFRAFLWLIELNLWLFTDWAPQTGAVALGVPPDPDFTDFGTQLMAIEISGGAPSQKVIVAGKTFGLKTLDGGLYHHSFMAATDDAGGSTLRVGFRDASNNPISDLTDQVYALSTTPTLFKWESIESDDPDFTSAKLVIFDNGGDIDSGQTVTLTDLMLEGSNGIASYVGPFRPSPDEPDIGRWGDLIETLFEAKRVASPRHRISVTKDGLAHEYVPPGVTWSPEIAGTSRTASGNDIGSLLLAVNAALTTITLPADADADIPVNSSIAARAQGTGGFVYAAGSGATVTPKLGGGYGSDGQYDVVQAVKVAPDTYVVL